MKKLRTLQFLSIFWTPIMIFIDRGFELYLPSIVLEKFGFMWVLWSSCLQPSIWVCCFLYLEKAIEQKQLKVVKNLRTFRFLSVFFTPIMLFVYSGFELYLPWIIQESLLQTWFIWHFGAQIWIWICCFICFNANEDALLKQEKQKLNESMQRTLDRLNKDYE